MNTAPRLVDHLPLLADTVRGRVLALLERHELTVSELCRVLGLPQSTASRHLKTLGDAGWLVSRADGTHRYYAFRTDRLEPSLRSLWLLIRSDLHARGDGATDDARLDEVLVARRSRSRAFFASAAGRWDQLREELFGSSFYLGGLLALLDDAIVGDLGCGTGQVAAALAPHVRSVIAVDESPEMLDAARQRLQSFANVDLRPGRLEALPIEDGALDAATLVLVLHHLSDPRAAVAETARALAPGGRVVVVDMLPHAREEYRSTMGHQWLGFAAPDVERMLAEAGFEKISVQPLPQPPKAKGPSLFVARARAKDRRSQ